MPDGAVYVYGVVPASERAASDAVGVGGAKVRRVEDGGLAAVVSDLQQEALSAPREVRNHWRVLEEIGESATVLPTRFGTVMESDRAVRERLLGSNAQHLEHLLRDLAGRAQLNVTGRYEEERLLHEVVRRSPEVAALRERVRSVPREAGYYDRIRLGELVAAEIARCREQDASAALERLERIAVAARAEEPRTADAAFNLSFLVERARIDAFSAAVAVLQEQFGERIRIRYVGPLPPYSFADADLTERGAAWA